MDRDERGCIGHDTQTERGYLTMSYILDALKKSEAERSRGSVPTLLIPAQTQFRSSVVVWVIVFALIVNAGLIAAWMFWPATQPTAARAPQTEPSTTASTSPNNIAMSRAEPSIPDVPVTSAAAPAAAAVEEPLPPPVETVAPTRIEPPTSPSAGEAATPAFSFSTHVYASDPSMRAVTMNGKRFVEGDTISAGVTLKEITESGVVLDINGRIVPMDVLQDWR